MSESLAHKRKIVLIHPVVLQDLVTEGCRQPPVVCVAGLPQDATFVRGYYDPQANTFGLIFEHPSWAAVPDGQPYPVISVRMQEANGPQQ